MGCHGMSWDVSGSDTPLLRNLSTEPFYHFAFLRDEHVVKTPSIGGSAVDTTHVRTPSHARHVRGPGSFVRLDPDLVVHRWCTGGASCGMDALHGHNHSCAS